MDDLTQEMLQHLFDYNPETGELRWKNPPARSHVKPGDMAGFYDGDGYRGVKILGRIRRAHRVIWMMCNGSEPDGQIDHINHIRDDNRIDNLRVVTCRENNQNRVNQSEFGPGVRRCGGKFHAQISHNKKLTHIGVFNSPAVAQSAYELAEWYINNNNYVPGADYFYDVFGPQEGRVNSSKSGTGVRKLTGGGFQARIKRNGKYTNLGTYSTSYAAAMAYRVGKWCLINHGHVPSKEAIKEAIAA